eukprot:SAG31_NODE_3329_length_4400_cov_2.494071_3_plen_91_part_00
MQTAAKENESKPPRLLVSALQRLALAQMLPTSSGPSRWLQAGGMGAAISGARGALREWTLLVTIAEEMLPHFASIEVTARHSSTLPCDAW